ncbi:amidohydrolase [Streptomyces sp. Ac-502]|uniref:amidohydrolase n=1 Tax=Streptomyces sp. Ac-502 TaxID=3342801 RepID=UPI0038625366
MPGPADLVLVNGTVLTVDAAFRRTQAVAVRDGLIAATGSTAEIRALIGPRTEVVDLEGRTALPGINDSHLHAAAFGATRPPLALDVAWPAVSSITGVREAVRRRAGELPAGDWIFGNGWDTGYLKECLAEPGRAPRRQDLDEVSPEHPVLLYEFSGHTSWLNSRALQAAGITATTPVPPGGVIETDADGAPTGILREGAQDLVNAVVPLMDDSAREAAVRSAIAVCHAEGITSFTEPGLGPGGTSLFLGVADTETLNVYARLESAGELRARVSVLLLPWRWAARHGICPTGWPSWKGCARQPTRGGCAYSASSCSPTASRRAVRPGCTRSTRAAGTAVSVCTATATPSGSRS